MFTVGFAENVFYISGKVKLSDLEYTEGIEVRLYNDVEREREEDLISQTVTDIDGDYMVEVPFINTTYGIHISYPNYESFRDKVKIIDEEPFLNATLVPAAVSDTVLVVSLVGDFNKFNWKNSVEMTHVGNSIYQVEIAYDKPQMRYQFLFDTEHHSYSNTINSDSYEYDHGGDYYSVTSSKTGIYKISADLDKFTKYHNQENKENSTGKWSNNPLSEEYTKTKQIVEEMNLVLKASILIYGRGSVEDRRSFFRNYSDDEIEEIIAKTKISFEESEKSIDDMLKQSLYQSTIDYLLNQKIYLSLLSDYEKNIAESWSNFKQISNLSFTSYNGSYYMMMNSSEFRENEEESLEIVERKIRSSYRGLQRERNILDYYRKLLDYDQAVYKGEKYSAMILEKMNLMESSSESLKEEIEQLKYSINFYSMKIAPDFDFTDIENKTYKLSDFKGKFVLLDFWSTWCVPCEMEIKNIKKAREMFDEDKLAIIGVAWETDSATVIKFAEEHEKNWIITLDYDHSIIEKYAVTGIPHLFLIDKEGKFVNTEKILRGENIYKELEKHIIPVKE